MLLTVIAGIGSLLVGAGLGLALRKYAHLYLLKKAKQEAQDILAEARDELEIRSLEEKERIQEIELELWSKVEPDMLKIEGRLEEAQELIDEKKQKADAALNEERKKLQAHEGEVIQQEKAGRDQEGELQKIRGQQKQLNTDYTQLLS